MAEESRFYGRGFSDERSTGTAIVNEIVKSYGFNVTDRGVDWSVDNIVSSFKEDPLWSTVDWLTVGVPVARWGAAVRGVRAGSGAVAEAYRASRAARGAVVGQFPMVEAAGEFYGKKATTRGGRAIARMFGDEELGYAAELYTRSPRQSPFRQGLDAAIGGGLAAAGFKKAAEFVRRDRGIFTNPISVTLDDEYISLVDKYGASPYELRQIKRVHDREKRLEQGLHQRIAGDAIREWGRAGLTEEQRRTGARFLEQGIEPGTVGAVAPGVNLDLVKASLGERGANAYRATWEYRNQIHQDAFDLGLISEETYLKHLKTYAPRIYEEWVDVHETLGKLRREGVDVSAIKGGIPEGGGLGGLAGEEAGKMQAAGRSGYARFKQRKEFEVATPEGEAVKIEFKDTGLLSQILDPRTQLEELSRAGWVIANQRYVQRLAGSAVAKSPDEILGVAEKIIAGDKTLQALHQISDDRVADITRLSARLAKLGRPMQAEEVAAAMGWKTIDELYAGTKIGTNYLDRIPKELRGKMLDPRAADDVMGLVQFGVENDKLPMAVYKGALSMFRAGKTAYHPATHVRNWIGSMVQHHLTTGGLPTLIPRAGYKAFMAGDESTLYRAAREAGIIGGAYDAEIKENLVEAFGKGLKQFPGDVSAVDWVEKVMPERFANAIKKNASKAESLYRSEDEVWKLDAWITQVERYQKNGAAAEEAYKLATRDVNKFMANFASHSDVANFVRQLVPFTSFTTEALRIWKNALAEKPHLAFFWNHMAEELSYSFGAMAGLSPSELESSKEAMPFYMQGKKLMALPITVDGVPRFIDLSYVIPLANLVEAEQSENMFFGALIDPTTNPILGLVAAGTTGIDPFSGREVRPRFTERQLGVPVTSEVGRKLVGLAEYGVAAFLPPLVPPGYAGVNLLEAARGQLSPLTGEKLEDGVLRTVLSNVGGIRYYAPGPESLVMNAERRERESSARVSGAWDRWEFARANGDSATMLAEQQRIVALREAFGDAPDEAEEYFVGNAPRHEAGAFAQLSRKELEGIMAQAKALPGLSDKDRRVMSALTDRYQRMVNRGKERRKLPTRPRSSRVNP